MKTKLLIGILGLASVSGAFAKDYDENASTHIAVESIYHSVDPTQTVSDEEYAKIEKEVTEAFKNTPKSSYDFMVVSNYVCWGFVAIDKAKVRAELGQNHKILRLNDKIGNEYRMTNDPVRTAKEVRAKLEKDFAKVQELFEKGFFEIRVTCSQKPMENMPFVDMK